MFDEQVEEFRSDGHGMAARRPGYPGFRGIPEEVLFDNRGFPGFTRAEYPPAIHPPPVEEGGFLPIMLKHN